MKKHIAAHLLQVSSFYSALKEASSASFHSTISSSHHVNTTSRMRLPIRTRLFHFPVWIDVAILLSSFPSSRESFHYRRTDIRLETLSAVDASSLHQNENGRSSLL